MHPKSECKKPKCNLIVTLGSAKSVHEMSLWMRFDPSHLIQFRNMKRVVMKRLNNVILKIISIPMLNRFSGNG